MDRMRDAISPLFTDVTWGAGGSTAELTLELALYAHKNGHVSNMHLTCTNMEKDGDPKLAVKEALQKSYDSGLRNLVALRGDPPAGQDEWKAAEGGFTCALDLVKFIREEHGDAFGISVAGYPEGHPNAISEIEDPSTMTESEKARSSCFDGKSYTCKDEDYKKEMDYLKLKVDAGAGTKNNFVMSKTDLLEHVVPAIPFFSKTHMCAFCSNIYLFLFVICWSDVHQIS
jgi:methylenetetrahydrofolate reductase (NADPH)